MRRAGLVLLLLVAACQEPEQPPIEPPQAVTDTMPFIYPVDLWDLNISGQTVVLLRITELGAVDSVAVAQSSGYAEFDSAALQGARKLKFIAGRMGERRVPMWTKLPVRFKRDTARLGMPES